MNMPQGECLAGEGREFGRRDGRHRLTEREGAQGLGSPAGHRETENSGSASGIRAEACSDPTCGGCGTDERGFADTALDPLQKQGGGVLTCPRRLVQVEY